MILQEIPKVFTESECAKLRKSVIESLIDQEDDCEEFDFDRTHVRNDDLAVLLCDRLRFVLDTSLHDREYFVHPSFAYTRYNLGGQLGLHRDGYKTEDDARSVASILLYLNADFEGGQTELGDRVVQPEVGKVLVLPQDLLHRARPIQVGTKFLIRTDLMVKNFKLFHDRSKTEELYAALFA